MNRDQGRDQARGLISQTFTKAFDKSRFRNFVINLLNHFDENKASAMTVPDAFARHIRSCWRLGTYKSPEGELADVLIVNTTEAYKLEHTRTALRDFVAHKLKRQDSYKEAGLVAFVSTDSHSWRFSYIHMEYESKRDRKTEKIAVEERLTPARRFSYIVGEGESCHTAQTRFVDLLQKTDSDPSLADIQEAFSVEAVTKEFFTNYVELFEKIEKALKKLAAEDETIKKEFETKRVSTVDFTKKLMGQIVFLYFLQKKGWLGVAKGQDWGTGPHDFLRKLAKGEYGKYDNFLNDILEPLFYDTLATDRGHEAWCNHFNCRIPFLNGGLFEPLGDYNWKKTNILLPNNLFTNTKFVEEGVIGTGVLDVFDRYNFTVNEAEPLEQEVAIDPEMLGKVFENLIEENRRKGLGQFYTPREIVHYMCQESLVNYLDGAVNKDMLLVPRSDIETFVQLGEQISHYESVEAVYPVKMPESVQKHARFIDDSLARVTVCDPAVGSGAFPVGMMTEIIRSRSALTPYFNDVDERTSYHFKHHAIQNCLYGVDIDGSAVEIAKLRLWLSLVVDEEDVKQIKPLPNLDYRVVTGNSLMGFPYKSHGLQEIENLKRKFFDSTDHTEKANLKTLIDRRLKTCLEDSKKSLGYEVTFDFEIFFSEVFRGEGGFDVVIGNPPYVSYGLRGGQTLEKEDKAFLKTAFPDSAEYKISLYAVFMEKSIRLSKAEGGINSLIVPDSFVLGMYFSKIRAYVLRNCLMRYILLLPFSVFKSVVGFSVVYQFERRKNVADSFLFTASTAPSALAVGRREFTQYSYPQSHFKRQNRNKFRLFFDPQSKKLVEKCETGSVRLESLVTFSSGLIGKDGQKAIISKGKPSNQWRRGLISGGEIKRYIIAPDGYYLLYDKSAIKSGYDCVNYFVPKLFMRQTGDSLICAYDDQGLLCLNNVHVGNFLDGGPLPHLLVGVLNSRLLNWFYQTIALEVGRVMPQTDIETLDDLPIKCGTGVGQIPELVETVLAAKKRDPEANTMALERDIDRHVYALYGLTKEEIDLVEGSQAK